MDRPELLRQKAFPIYGFLSRRGGRRVLEGEGGTRRKRIPLGGPGPSKPASSTRIPRDLRNPVTRERKLTAHQLFATKNRALCYCELLPRAELHRRIPRTLSIPRNPPAHDHRWNHPLRGKDGLQV